MSQRQRFFSVQDFASLSPLVRCAEGVWDELKLVDLHWMQYAADHEKHLTGEWLTAMVYRRDSIFVRRKTKPRPNLTNAEQRKAVAAIRRLPKQIPGLTRWFDSFKAINFVGISKMPPGSMLAPHRHFNPNSLVMHVALDVPPEGSGIMVEDETFIWSKPGQCVIFDDSLHHSAWNHGDGERTILHVDFERKVG